MREREGEICVLLAGVSGWREAQHHRKEASPNWSRNWRHNSRVEFVTRWVGSRMARPFSRAILRVQMLRKDIHGPAIDSGGSGDVSGYKWGQFIWRSLFFFPLRSIVDLMEYFDHHNRNIIKHIWKYYK